MNYGARKEIHPNTLKECVDFVVKKFSYFGIDEIKEAYMDWASGDIKIEGAEMYGGVFNVAQLGKVLRAYDIERRKVVAILLQEQDREERLKKDKVRQQKMKDNFEVEFPKKVKRAKEEIIDWREIPVFWYKTMKKKGWINLTKEEGLDIWEDAREWAEIELKQRKEGAKSIFENWDDKDFNAIRKNVAGQIAVFRKVILNKDFIIPNL